MGLSPADVMALPLHDYQAALYHYGKAQSGDEDGEAPLGADDFDEMLVGLAGSGMIN